MGLNEALKISYENKTYCEFYDSFYPSQDYDSHHGQVIGYNDKCAVFETLGEFGDYMGYRWIRLNRLSFVLPYSNCAYTSKQLIKLRGIEFDHPVLKLGADYLKSIIDYAIDTEQVCEIRLNNFEEDDSSLYGYIATHDGNNIGMRIIEEDGYEADGIEEFDTDNIDLLVVGGLKLDCLGLLHDHYYDEE